MKVVLSLLTLCATSYCFCNFNQQLHITVYRFTIIFLKTLHSACFGHYWSIIREHIKLLYKTIINDPCICGRIDGNSSV